MESEGIGCLGESLLQITHMERARPPVLTVTVCCCMEVTCSFPCLSAPKQPHRNCINSVKSLLGLLATAYYWLSLTS